MNDTYVTYLSIEEVLDFLQDTYNLEVSKASWRRWVKEGYAPQPVRVGRRNVRWRQHGIEEWVGRVDAESSTERVES